MSETSVTGQCLCGAIGFRAERPPRFVAHCHCENCRRAHGAAFVTWIGFNKSQFTLEDPNGFLVGYHTDTQATRSFCKSCGTTLFFEAPRWEGEIHIALANVTDSHDLEPDAHVYADRAVSWCPINDDLARYGGKSGTEPLG